jgi:hypothetical protein
MIDDGTKFLTNLAKDPGEENNLAASQPAKVAQLEAKILAWEKDVASPRLKDFVAPAPARK